MRSFLAGIWIAIAASACGSLPTAAMMNQLIVNDPDVVLPAYTGLGDLIPGADFYVGLRAYSSATRGNSAIDIQRNSDSATCTAVKTLVVTGDLDVSSGTPCGGATVTSFCNATTCTITKGYDQTGNAHHWTQATVAKQPILVLSCTPNSKPCMQSSSPDCTGTTTTIMSGATGLTAGNLWMDSIVAERTGCTSQTNRIWGGGSGGSATAAWFGTAASTVSIFEGSTASVGSVTDSSFHALQEIYERTTSTINVDGTGHSVNAGSNTLGPPATFGVFADATSVQSLNGKLTEFSRWFEASSGSLCNATCQSNISSNQHTYWGF